ncbi:hypothetical protein KCP73_10980 [Salmonella enterica subsp. enterica]|nr:hypothetical protein KCP73_10980 [Salmonella enterica subsp. enterica]
MLPVGLGRNSWSRCWRPSSPASILPIDRDTTSRARFERQSARKFTARKAHSGIGNKCCGESVITSWRRCRTLMRALFFRRFSHPAERAQLCYSAAPARAGNSEAVPKRNILSIPAANVTAGVGMRLRSRRANGGKRSSFRRGPASRHYSRRGSQQSAGARLSPAVA